MKLHEGDHHHVCGRPGEDGDLKETRKELRVKDQDEQLKVVSEEAEAVLLIGQLP